jgi:hypothetical protein
MVSIANRLRWLAGLLIVLMLVVACGGGDDASDSASSATVGGGGPDHMHVESSPVESEEPVEMQVYLVASELVVGENRFAVGLQLPDNAIIDEAEVAFTYYDLSDPMNPVRESEADAERLESLDGLTVIYADERAFDRAGRWGVQIDATQPDGTTLSRNIVFDVLADSTALMIGEQAPEIDSPTAADVDGDLTKLTSASEPNAAFYDLSIADALASDKPTVLLFATPAFCQTRFCGPDYEITSGLQQRYGEQLNFVHVEVYSGLPNPEANGFQFAEPMDDFGLRTEPWLYVIDDDGTVTWRVEGLFTEGEVVAALAGVGVD